MTEDSLRPESTLKGWDPTPHRYWRRFFARWVDYCICMGIALFLLQFPVYDFLERELFGEAGCEQFDPVEQVECYATVYRTYAPFAVIIGTGLGSFVIAGLIASTGASVGKWIFGVRVLGKDLRPVGYKVALKRELLLWLRGFGLGIPIVSFVTMLIAQHKLVKRGTTSWDAELGTIVYYRKTKIYWMALALLVGYFAFQVLAHFLAHEDRQPRPAQTLEQFQSQGDRIDSEHYTILSVPETHTIKVSGKILPGFSAALGQMLAKYPSVQTIRITSPGGVISETHNAAQRIIHLSGVTTIADEVCRSSCILLLMAGERRLASWHMGLGFHAPLLPPNLDAQSIRDENVNIQRADQYLVERGLPEEFTLRYFEENFPEEEVHVSAINFVRAGILQGLVDDLGDVSVETAINRIITNSPDKLEEAGLFALLLRSVYDTGLPMENGGIGIDMTNRIIQRAALASDDAALYAYNLYDFEQIKNSHDSGQWAACAKIYRGTSIRTPAEFIALDEGAVIHRESITMAVLKSAIGRDWQPVHIPAWAEEIGTEILNEAVRDLENAGYVFDDTESDDFAACLFGYSLYNKILSHTHNQAAAILRWGFSP